MIDYIIKIFIKDYNSEINDNLRFKLANLSSYIGLFANFILFVIKLIIGFYVSSVSIIADGFNNLFDMISSSIALIGFKISKKPADSEHPFGHGRVEIISDLLVGIVIVFFSLELIKVSVDKIILNSEVKYSSISVYILIVSIFIKLFHAKFVSSVGEKIESNILLTTAKDSYNDVILTIFIIISIVIEKSFNLKIDGYVGLVLAIYIIYSGLTSIIKSSKELLGERISDERILEMEKLLLSYDDILGFHDLIVHKYGHNQYFATVHVEVNSEYSLIYVHDLIDKIEYDFKHLLNVNLVVHPDPIILNDPKLINYQSKIKEIIYNYNSNYSIHDFRIIKHNNYSLIIFDLVVFDEEKNDKQIKNDLKKLLAKDFINYKIKITIDRNYLLGR